MLLVTGFMEVRILNLPQSVLEKACLVPRFELGVFALAVMGTVDFLTLEEVEWLGGGDSVLLEFVRFLFRLRL